MFVIISRGVTTTFRALEYTGNVPVSAVSKLGANRFGVL